LIKELVKFSIKKQANLNLACFFEKEREPQEMVLTKSRGSMYFIFRGR